MRPFRHFLSVALIGGVAASCGSTDTTPDATALPDVAEFDASLAAALGNSEVVGALRILTYRAQSLQIDLLDVDSSAVLDLDEPTLVLESDGTGSSHLTMDVGAQFAATNPALGELGEITLEIWNTPDLLLMDTTGYAPLEEMNPGQLGVFSPGVFTVDLERVGDVGGADLAQLLVGSTVPDIGDIAAGLLDKLESPTALDGDTDTFVGSMTFGERLREHTIEIGLEIDPHHHRERG